MHAGLLAGITWDPFIRGVVILAVFIIVLPGSVYLVLATNTGVRLGLLLAAAGVTGLMFMLAILWMVLSSTADVGRANSWKPLQVVTGDFKSQVTVKGVQDFPVDALRSIPPAPSALPSKHWYWPLQSCHSDNRLHQENPAKLTDTESAADKVLVPSSTGLTRSQLATPFTLATDYVYIDGFEKGANGGCLFAIRRHKVYLPLGRGPHYVIMRAQPALPVPATSTAKPQPNASKPYSYVVLERNLGSVREPQFIMAVVMGIIFLILCDTLHRRDKEIAARRARPPEGPGDGGGGSGGGGTGGGGEGAEGVREPVGAPS
jgi:hypothetical protein